MLQRQPIRSVAVFCGSRLGTDPAHRTAAAALGAGLAEAGMRLVYGGGNVGLMGAVADGVLHAGGTVLGIIPDFLQRREVAHDGVQSMVVTGTMHDRKQRMYEAADAFVTMPGGLGTFDETIEVTTWRQLGLHDKPILICDVGGWAQPYLALMRAAVDQGFAAEDTVRLFDVLPDVPSVLHRLRHATAADAGQPGRI